MLIIIILITLVHARYVFELREIGRLKGKIIAKMAKSTVNDLKKQMEDLSKQLEGGLEGFMEEINNEENN